VEGARAQTPHVVESAGAVMEELDGTVKITALHRDPATTVIPTGTYLLEAVVAAVVGMEKKGSKGGERRHS